MPNITPISKEKHKNKSWTKYASYQFAAKDILAPLVGAEVAKAVLAFPMAFMKQQTNFTLVAVLSLTPGQNMFVAPNGQWLGSYVPSAYRGYPFRLAKAEGNEDLILCVDEDSGLINDDPNAGEPFFDESGETSKQVKDILNFLGQIEQSRTVTQLAVASLDEAGVITEWNLKVKVGEEEKPVAGLYTIDEAKLNNLEDDQFLRLRKTGGLPIAYGQLLSMGNVVVFERLAKIHEQMGKQQQQPAPDFGINLGDDDTFHF